MSDSQFTINNAALCIVHCALIASSFFFFALRSSAQNVAGGTLHGNFELDAQYYRPDSLIGEPAVPQKMLENSFVNFIYQNNDFSAGLRYESYLDPLLGYDPRYTGSGIAYRYLRFNKDGLDVTAGNFYEQFGSGLVFRTYQSFALGYDNSMDGIRVKYNPAPGVYLKGVIGNERSFWTEGSGIVRGIDGEANINQLFKARADKPTNWIVGGSFVSKYQVAQSPTYILPQNVGAGAVRINFTSGGWDIYAEQAMKANDPSADNNYIYQNGYATYFTATYSEPGFGANFGFHRLDNMSFRSDRAAVTTNLLINYLPALTKDHTYLLLNIYPYATQPEGEEGMQGEVFFNLKPASPFGGKYGTDITLNFSVINSINKQVTDTIGDYTSNPFKIGNEVYFQDFNAEVTKKLSKKVKLIFTYAYVIYNKDVIQGTPGYGIIYSNIAIAELSWKINSKKNLRTELQNLYTKEDQQSWAVLLAELTFVPHWFVAAFDEYNYGNDIADQRIHYYTGQLGYTKNTNRITIGYGRQRAGILCVGGVCRNVPASDGITLSMTSSF